MLCVTSLADGYTNSLVLSLYACRFAKKLKGLRKAKVTEIESKITQSCGEGKTLHSHIPGNLYLAKGGSIQLIYLPPCERENPENLDIPVLLEVKCESFQHIYPDKSMASNLMSCSSI